MAAKQRSRRITQPVKKRRAKKRVSSAAAKKRGGRKSAIAVPGMVETAIREEVERQFKKPRSELRI